MHYDEYGQPSWASPPGAISGGILPVQRILLRTDQVSVVLTEIRSFETGCVFDLTAAVRRGDGQLNDLLDDVTAQTDAIFTSALDRPTLGPRFHIELAGGVVIHEGGWSRPGLARDRVPAQPVLIVLSGDAGGVERDLLVIRRPLWLWSRPRAGMFHLVTDWPATGLSPTRVTIDADALEQASRTSVALWD